MYTAVVCSAAGTARYCSGTGTAGTGLPVLVLLVCNSASSWCCRCTRTAVLSATCIHLTSFAATSIGPYIASNLAISSYRVCLPFDVSRSNSVVMMMVFIDTLSVHHCLHTLLLFLYLAALAVRKF
eukprot:SAG31_NODE_12155_length_963_cov_7.013889_1_plen_125_part_01